MVILAIDTTTRGGSVAVTRDNEQLSLVGGDETRTHGERMPAEIAHALEQAGISKSDLDLISVAAGPGAFTGLRIGLAAAQGVALTLDRPVVGVSTLDALAWTIAVEAPAAESGPGDALIAPWMDAQRGDVFAALYRSNPIRLRAKAEGLREHSWPPWTVIDRPVTARPRVVLESWQSHAGHADVVFVGDAVSRDEALIAQIGEGRWRLRQPDPLAPAIAAIGRRLALEGRAGKPHVLTPIYARRPDAEIDRERRRPS
ncbi:MAG: tRNA (adenosine(37)-N6)-threonylcarbamoyltransferase complex dimerization subunit type 1 TsaB [Vicinamibacterales bacterium]